MFAVVSTHFSWCSFDEQLSCYSFKSFLRLLVMMLRWDGFTLIEMFMLFRLILFSIFVMLQNLHGSRSTWITLKNHGTRKNLKEIPGNLWFLILILENGMKVGKKAKLQISAPSWGLNNATPLNYWNKLEKALSRGIVETFFFFKLSHLRLQILI